MRAIPTRAHSVFDYFIGLVLIGLPSLLDLSDGPSRWVLWGVGAALILYSLATDYELGALRRLQMPVHLWLDALAGVLLAISPWLFGFDRIVWIPHLAVGLLLIATAILSQTIPGYERRRA